MHCCGVLGRNSGSTGRFFFRFWKTVVLVDPCWSYFSPWKLPSYASCLDERYIFPWYSRYIILYSQSIPNMVLFNMLSNQLNYSVYIYIYVYIHIQLLLLLLLLLLYIYTRYLSRSDLLVPKSNNGKQCIRRVGAQFWVCRGVSPCFGHGFFRCVLVVWDMYMWLVMMNSSNS